MSRQLPLALRLRSSASLADFIYGDGGALENLLQQQRTGGQELVYLHGAAASGKSHLLAGQCDAMQRSGFQVAYLPCRDHADLPPRMLDNLEQLDLIAIDDVHRLAGLDAWERALFHLFNRARERGCRLLFSATGAPAQLPITLADLRSRFGWGVVMAIPLLDDPSRQRLLCQMARHRGLDMPEAVARYLVERRPRSSPALLALIDRLDRASLSEQRRLSIPFVREQLSLL